MAVSDTKEPWHGGYPIRAVGRNRRVDGASVASIANGAQDTIATAKVKPCTTRASTHARRAMTGVLWLRREALRTRVAYLLERLQFLYDDWLVTLLARGGG